MKSKSCTRSASRVSLNKENGTAKRRRCNCYNKEVTELRTCPSRPRCRDFIKEKQKCILKYEQPERPESYKPIHVYKKPETHIDENTVYKLSYPGVDAETAAECRGEQTRHHDNLTSAGKFSSDTTHKHDYRGWPGANRANIIMPETRSLGGEGPMQSQTTHKHDYTPKSILKSVPFKPDNNIRLSDKRMEDISTMNASYQPVEKYDPAESFKPHKFYKAPSSPFEGDTVQKMSYVPWPVKEKEDYPWASKGKYMKPIMPMDGSTIYNNSYLPTSEDARRELIKHMSNANILGAGRDFEDRTVYKQSYLPVDEDCRPKPFTASDNLKTADAKFADQTTNKHDYRGWPGANRANLIMPEKHSLLGEGPMQSLTTQKHDYRPKPYTRLTPFKPDNNIRLSDKRMEDTSTMNASYQPIEKYDPAESFKPHKFYKAPSSPFEGDTVQKMSYVPWPVKDKENYPWASKGKYMKPIMPMEGSTIYNNSAIKAKASKAAIHGGLFSDVKASKTMEDTAKPGKQSTEFSYLPTSEDVRREPIRHMSNANILGAGRNFEDRTVYKQSYLPADEDCREKPFSASDNLKIADVKFADETTNKHDYKGWPGANRANLIMPEKRSLLGEGPMQSLTTHKHDYQPKPFTKVHGFKPDINIRLSDKRMEDTSTMNASYQPIEKYDPAESFKPHKFYKAPSSPFEGDTVQKMSYVPWPVKEKEDHPWASKGKYNIPVVPFEGSTIYKNSFMAPGKFVCDEEQAFVGAGDSVDCTCRCCC